ncbi:hypothetical protein AB3S75_045120 [Citrus x aurantiifolia]
METLNFVTLTFETLTVIALEKHKPSKQIKFSQFYLESITARSVVSACSILDWNTTWIML